jgi:hypothetical protein
MNDAKAIRGLGRTTGRLYLVLVVFGMFSPIVLETLVVPGDAAATAGNILGSLWLFRFSLVSWILIVVTDIALSGVLYLLFEPTSRLVSLISAAFRGVYSTILAAYSLSLFRGLSFLTDPDRGAALGLPDVQAQALAEFESFSSGFVLALLFFGVHLILFGVLLKRSRYVPSALAVLIGVAGAGYILNSLATFFLPNHGDLASTVLLTPALLGEVGLTGWLLVKGVSVVAESEHAHGT